MRVCLIGLFCEAFYLIFVIFNLDYLLNIIAAGLAWFVFNFSWTVDVKVMEIQIILLAEKRFRVIFFIWNYCICWEHDRHWIDGLRFIYDIGTLIYNYIFKKINYK